MDQLAWTMETLFGALFSRGFSKGYCFRVFILFDRLIEDLVFGFVFLTIGFEAGLLDKIWKHFFTAAFFSLLFW